MTKYFKSQLVQIIKGGRAVLIRKIILAAQLIPAFLLVMLIRLIKPFLLVRWGEMSSPRIGHFAANTELYLCERDANINVPKQRHLDIFLMDPLICNLQLEKMWRRVIRVWPLFWLLPAIRRVNSLFPGAEVHEIGDNSQSDRDVHNLLDRFPAHLSFTAEEQVLGNNGLRKMGIPPGALFVCLIVRDAAYLNSHQEKDWSYHNYRDSEIRNYVLAAETLAERGYYVIRMGAKVNEAMKSSSPRIIDYATNGMRSDFMDIYLGATCVFCISVGTGFDAIPIIFRRPVAFVNFVPAGYFPTFSKRYLGIFKRHLDRKNNYELTLKEIFLRGCGLTDRTVEFAFKDVKLLDNTPEEIRDLVIEMAERLSGTWKEHPDDKILQQRFWEIFPSDAKDVVAGNPLHGEIHASFGATFLRNNRAWLE